MKYLPFIESAIARLGYLKPEYAAAIAVLMEEHEWQHPRQVARLFRQHGVSLTADQKRAIKIRANADMTTEAYEALTEKGRGNPIDGPEQTLLHAMFAYFRARSVAGALEAGYDRFAIDGMFASDCAGCRRLDDQIVTSSFLAELPPHDCQREACAIGMQLRIDFIQDLIDDEETRKAVPEKRPSLWARLFERR